MSRLQNDYEPAGFFNPDSEDALTTGPMRVMSLEEATGPNRIVPPAPAPDDLEAQLTAQGWLPPAQASFLMQQIASLRKLVDDIRCPHI